MLTFLYHLLTWSAWQHIGTATLLMSALPAIALPVTYAQTGSWRVTLASRSLMWMYSGIALVYAYLILNAGLGVAWPGRELVRFVVFLPFGYGIWRMWVTHLRYAHQKPPRGPQLTSKKWQAEAVVENDGEHPVA